VISRFYTSKKASTVRKIYYHRELKGVLVKGKAGDSFQFSIPGALKALLQ
jgi:hypothetical protein